jgi:outer membrane protein assembly factor BamB
LLAFRDIDRIAVVDVDRQRLVWEWGSGEMIGPHDPWLLENGNVMVFDNGSRPIDAHARAYSRVVEVDPRTGEIVWQYPREPDAKFFSPSRGGAQPLPNGNVLITESTKGHVFEVTRDGELVWDFWNPDFRSEDGLRRTIYRMRRMSMESYRKLRRLR